jgi:di/tricarboxylate transporter
LSLAWLSLTALLVVIVVSCLSKMNVGVLAIAMAWVLGVYFGGLKPDQVAAGFPVQLFVTLSGVTILFAQAQANGTLDKLAHKAVAGCRGNAGLIPVMFFLVAAGLASLGPGNIATAALIAPMAMAVAARAGIPAFLMALMVGNGANAGSLSPLAPTGIIATGLMNRIGLPGLEWQTFGTNLAAHALVAFCGYILFGGLALFRVRYEKGESDAADSTFDAKNWVTLATILALVAAVVFGKASVGMAAFAAAVVLGLSRSADVGEAIRKAPWNVIVMVTGVTVLISLLERTGGLALFTDLLAKFATAKTVTGMIAFVTGVISTYSSTSGVVLPAFLPTVPGLAERLGSPDARSIAFSINVGSHLVDVSPLSTIGALCIASVSTEEARPLFNKLMAWGLSMTVVGALICYLFFSRN